MKVKYIFNLVTLTLFTLFSLALSGCSGPLRVEITKENPPTFVLHGGGSGYLHGIVVEEYSSTGQGDNVWVIGPQGSFPLSHFSPTKIKYGELPSGWKQERPKDGSNPPPLMEGKTYVMICLMTNVESKAPIFTIKNGKAVQGK